MKEYRLCTSQGYYSKAANIAGYRFPERIDASHSGADVFETEVCAKRARQFAGKRLNVSSWFVEGAPK